MQNFLFLALAGMYFFCVFRMFARFSIVCPCMDFLCVPPRALNIYTELSCHSSLRDAPVHQKKKVYCINLNTFNFQFLDEIILYFLAGKQFHLQLLNERAIFLAKPRNHWKTNSPKTPAWEAIAYKASRFRDYWRSLKDKGFIRLEWLWSDWFFGLLFTFFLVRFVFKLL